MSDPKKTEEISRKINDLSRTMQSHKDNIDRLTRDKNDRVRDFDQRINRERDEMSRIQRQIEDLKRQL